MPAARGGKSLKVGLSASSRSLASASSASFTLGIISPSFVVLPYFRKLNYDPLKDFAPICELAAFPLLTR